MPAVFCNCAACVRAKKAGGKNIRTRSQLLINGKLLLDFPPDTYFHAVVNRLDLSQVMHVFITHAHPDHCSPAELALRGAPYAHGMTEPVLYVHGSETVIEKIKSSVGAQLTDAAQKSLSLRTIKPYEKICADKLTVTALPAQHTVGEDCFIYLIEDEKHAFLQFNDSGILPDEVYAYLKKQGVLLSAVAFDCTYGYLRKGAGRHMGMLDAADEKQRMKAFGILKPDCRYFLTHFSHNGSLPHDELSALAAKHGFIAAFDGLKVFLDEGNG